MSDERQKKFEQKKLVRDQEYYDPCRKEHNLSYKCLNNNNFDYDQCSMYFENYKICKRFWADVVSHRKANGITPHLPLPEDRERIKAEYIKSHRR